MGSSNKKKQDKRKDFQKTKFKIGKVKSKASNFTETSFQARSICVDSQRLHVVPPSTATQIEHHVVLLKAKSETQRKESLAFLTTAVIKSRDVFPMSIVMFLQKLYPLFLDRSPTVQQQLLKLLKTLPADEICGQINQSLLWQRTAMGHLSANIRTFSMDLLEWLLAVAPNWLVSCSGGWKNTLASFVELLGWHDHGQHCIGSLLVSGSVAQSQSPSGWTSQRHFNIVRPEHEARAAAKYFTTLATFIRAGIDQASVQQNQAERKGREREAVKQFPFNATNVYLLPQRNNAFTYLNLFGAGPDQEGVMYDDREDRQTVFRTCFERFIKAGIEQGRQEGGDAGRVATMVYRAMVDGMADYKW